jgi:hypothetical protein
LTSFLLRRLVISEGAADTCARISSLPPYKGEGELEAVSCPRVHDSDFVSESSEGTECLSKSRWAIEIDAEFFAFVVMEPFVTQWHSANSLTVIEE